MTTTVTDSVCMCVRITVTLHKQECSPPMPEEHSGNNNTTSSKWQYSQKTVLYYAELRKLPKMWESRRGSASSELSAASQRGAYYPGTLPPDRE